jgi:hypothetical protein
MSGVKASGIGLLWAASDVSASWMSDRGAQGAVAGDVSGAFRGLGGGRVIETG